MIIREDLHNGYVRVKSDSGKKIVRVSDRMEFTEAIVKKDSNVSFEEKEDAK